MVCCSDVRFYDFDAKIEVTLNNDEIIECNGYIETDGIFHQWWEDVTGEGGYITQDDSFINENEAVLIEADSKDEEISNKIETIGVKKLNKIIDVDWSVDEDTVTEECEDY